MFEPLFEEIKKAESIIIFGHINPDGDCYGSQQALKESLSLAFPNKKIYAVGSGYRRFFGLIGEMDDVEDSLFPKSLAILLDGNGLSRMEDQRIRKCKNFIKIDHHVDDGSYSEGPFVVDENASSTCELVCDFIQELDLPINEKVATGLLLGILTDTGRYQFVKDYGKVFRQSSYLASKGGDIKGINYILNQTNEFVVKFKGYVFTHYKIYKDKIPYLILDKNVLKEFKIHPAKAGSMVNLIGNITGFPIWVFFSEHVEENKWYLEIRSSGINVQKIASKYGGGGHVEAAGATLINPKEDLFMDILEDLYLSIEE